MKFVYVDEQENKKGGQNYTAATASVFLESSLIAFRRDLIKKMVKVIDPGAFDSLKFGQLPVLHASELPREMNDEEKLAIYDAVLTSVADHNVRIFRVGYFNESISSFIKTREQIIGFCLSNIVWPIGPLMDEPTSFVYELNQSVRRKFSSYNDTYMQEIYWQSGPRKGLVSIDNFENICGKYYCDKHNHHMYASDFCGYALSLQDKGTLSNFQNKIVQKIPVFEDLIDCNEIIYMKRID